MEKQKEKLIQWIKMYKKELIATGIAISATMLMLFIADHNVSLQELKVLIKKKSGGSVLKETADSSKSAASMCRQPENLTIGNGASGSGTASNVVPFDVSPHIRTYHDGRQAYIEKKATALENGFDLDKNQTWVKKYTKRNSVA